MMKDLTSFDANKKESQYQNPLIERYASKEMSYIFSADYKYKTWRKLWLVLAEEQKNVGLSITKEQIDEMRRVIEKEEIDYEVVARYEKSLRHDVMAHIHAFGDSCPTAASIIHLGATSNYVVDNAELIQMKVGLQLIKNKVQNVLASLSIFAERYKSTPTLGYTHYQVAQPTTVGKRACTWMQELLLDLQVIDFTTDKLPFRSIKGTTGTLASFKTLCNGDLKKVQTISSNITKQFGFDKELTITGQTYSRKLDSRVLSVMSAIAESASKFAVDMRLLQHERELSEPFGKQQVGSSAMAYKQNPMLSERICSIARFIQALRITTEQTAANQWLERSLDDSANKRLSISQAFLAVDAILDMYYYIASGIQVNEKVIEANVKRDMPFLITEHILMESLKRYEDKQSSHYNRQTLHEKIRLHSLEAKRKLMEEPHSANILFDLLASDNHFPFEKDELIAMAEPRLHTGFSEQLTDLFIANEIQLLLVDFKPPQQQQPKV